MKQKGKHELKQNERLWENQKVQIQYNVANRPLLVEQVSKAFIHNLKQICDLQKYVKILEEANIDPNEYLSQEQKELLQSAEYYDKLNHEKAFLPRLEGRKEHGYQNANLEQAEMELEGEQMDGSTNIQQQHLEAQLEHERIDEQQEEEDQAEQIE